MLKYVSRHGDADYKSGLLTPKGIEQARQLGIKLGSEHGIDLASEEVAVSEAARTQQTAKEAGFANLVINPLLNELGGWREIPNLVEILREGRIPDGALKAAEMILNDPPEQNVWVSHGFIIAGLCELQGVRYDEQVIPLECEMRQIPVG